MFEIDRVLLYLLSNVSVFAQQIYFIEKIGLAYHSFFISIDLV